MLGLGVAGAEDSPAFYLPRLCAYVLILVAIIDKNRRRGEQPLREPGMKAPPWSTAALLCALAGGASSQACLAPDLPGQTLGSTCRALPALAAPAIAGTSRRPCAPGTAACSCGAGGPGTEPPPAAGCVAPSARWWAWERARLAASAPALPAWETQWTGNAAAISTDPLRLAVLELGEGAVWQAREWEWTPSPRRATRAWQCGAGSSCCARSSKNARRPHRIPHRCADSASLGSAAAGAARRTQQSIAALASRWRVPAPDRRIAARTELPSRLRARRRLASNSAAMQVQLARRYPEASWLVPFRLIDLPGADGARARYLAVWQDKGGITGQLWLLTADGARAVRVQVSGTLQAGQNGAATAATIEQELTALARRLGQPHER
ncbi:hypothetical protein LP420_38810 [Massilia sp. B-10]|nr:hypothetical protein LP420_38810 [Massilia sp. B-10]